MPRTRLNARVFVLVRRKALGGIKSHCKKVIDFYKSVYVWHLLQPPIVFIVNKVMSNIDQAVKGLLESKWGADINREISHTGRGRNKLRTYRLFKHSFGKLHYLKDTHLTCAQRSAMTKMKCGVAPICLETGRYKGLTEQERICPVCDMDEIESEIQVTIFGHLYNDIRATHYESALLIDNDFNTYSNIDKCLFLMDNEGIIRHSAKTCYLILLEVEDMFT